MNGVRGQFLARTALALEQHIGRWRRDLLDGVEHFVQSERLADDIFKPVTLVHLLSQCAILLLEFAALQRTRD